jgi:thioredoxin-related protein
MKFGLSFILLFAVLSTHLRAEGDKEGGIVFMKNEPWETVLKKAKAENKLIFMDCYTVWCGPCKGLAQDIFPQKKVGDYFNAHFINVAYDMEKGDGKMLHEKYKKNIIGFPTLLLINDRGEVIHQMAGYKEADALIEGIKAGASGHSLFASEAKYNAGARDLETVSAYVSALNNAFLTDKIQPVINDYLETIPVDSLANADVWKTVGKYIIDPYSKAYRFVFDNIERKFQYRLKVDRYDLERQLGRKMSDAVNDILKISQTTRHADTLQLMKQRSEYLNEMLSQNTIRYFPTYAAKLQINALMLDNNPQEVYRTMLYLEPVGLFAGEKMFAGSIYRYIVENVTDRTILQSVAEKVTAMQNKQKSGNPALSYNFYDVLALAYTQLGDKAKAEEAQAEFDKRKAAKDEYYKQIVAKGKAAKADIVNE